MNALQRAAAYAVKPNEFGRCGPHNAHAILSEYVNNPASHDEMEIRQLLSQFEVAMPNYKLIASANGISDPLDPRVIEAYWLGNELIENVSAADVRTLISNDVEQSGWSKHQIAIMFAAITMKSAKPHHCLSVLYYYVFSGRNFAKQDDFKRRMDICRAASGRVVEVMPDKLIVAYNPLAFSGTEIVGLGSEANKAVDRGFIKDVTVGDMVSFHLDYGIEKLDEASVARLEHYTRSTITSIFGKH